MRILFQVSTTAMLRHFTDVVLTLAGRGHDVRVVHPEDPDTADTPPALENHERITFVHAPEGREDEWAQAVGELRPLRDYLRYLEKPFAHATKLRSRTFRKAVKAISGGAHRHFAMHCPHCHALVRDHQLVTALLENYADAPAALAARLAAIEATIPSDPRIDAVVREARPDVVVVTPLIRTASHQVEYVKSARAQRIPVAFPVFSWDNLSTKGVIHVLPDRVYVWNERQKTEAIELQRVPAERVTVVGAPRFDAFFAMTPSTSRDQFCEANRLDPAQPIIAYLCSSDFVAEKERDFVMRWVDEVRQHPCLAPCNIVIRPHPRNKTEWRKYNTGRDRVAVTMSASVTGDQSLFDTLHHSAAVVGLNTSAQLEAGVVGRPVLTLLAPEFANGQTGTLHFQYLLRQEGGFVELAPDFDSHRAQLAAAVAGRCDANRIRGFIEDFLRPRGRDRAVSPMLADEIEELARSGRRQRSWWSRLAASRFAARRP